MRLFNRMVGAAILGTALMGFSGYTAFGNRTGGPASEVATVEARQSKHFDIPFNAFEPAVVSVVGSGVGSLELIMSDADGHIVTGIGFEDRKTVSMAVYRAGTLHVEVINPGPQANTFLITTN